MTKKERLTLQELLSEFGCMGPCEHGLCHKEIECEECGLEYDTWCLACRIYKELNIRNT